MTKRIILEICAGSVEDCIAAEQNGADRIELCSALPLGGLTPSLGLFQEVKKNCDLEICPIIRPRAGGFYYTDFEYSTAFADAKILLEAGADGIVFGFLHPNSTIDQDRTREFVELAKSFNKTAIFHRAFDISNYLGKAANAENLVTNLSKNLEILIDLGIDRVLTSGGKTSAPDGANVIQELQKNYGTKIEILAGSGVTNQNVAELISKTQVNQIHSTAKGAIPDAAAASKFISYSENGKTIFIDSDQNITRQSANSEFITLIRQAIDY